MPTNMTVISPANARPLRHCVNNLNYSDYPDERREHHSLHNADSAGEEIVHDRENNSEYDSAEYIVKDTERGDKAWVNR